MGATVILQIHTRHSNLLLRPFRADALISSYRIGLTHPILYDDGLSGLYILLSDLIMHTLGVNPSMQASKSEYHEPKGLKGRYIRKMGVSPSAYDGSKPICVRWE